MGVALDPLSEMATRDERDRRLALALLSKSRYLLPHPAPEMETARVGIADKQADALSALSALQSSSIKRQRIISKHSNSNNNNSENASSTSAGRRDRAWQVITSRRGTNGLPRARHIALQGLSSFDAHALKRVISDLPQDIARLNARHRHIPTVAGDKADSTLIATPKVFGWRNYLLRQPGSSTEVTTDDSTCTTATSSAESTSKSVVWKSTKTFESTAMQPLAQRVWDSLRVLAQDSTASRISSFEVLYTASASVRVVKLIDTLYGRRAQETIWVECLFEGKDHICIGRKQLTHFRNQHLGGDQSAPSRLGDLECEGFLFRPHLTKLSEEDGTLMLGSTLQRVSLVTCRDAPSPDALVQNIIDDLPRATLQWEEVVVHDLLPQISF